MKLTQNGALFLASPLAMLGVGLAYCDWWLGFWCMCAVACVAVLKEISDACDGNGD